MKRFLPLTSVFVIAGCANGPSVMSYEDASAFERSLLARETSLPTMPDKLYTQPANKKEPCKLPTTQDQIERPNFQAYWDGECKNGFAFGLGRDIAISDTHHVEEITIHEGNGNNWQQPRVVYDYVNNTVKYAIGESSFPASTGITEEMDNGTAGFNAHQTLTVVDKLGKAFIIQSSAFKPERVYINTNTEQSIRYQFVDYSATPLLNPNNPIFTAEIFDPQNDVASEGILIAHYSNGAVQHFKVNNGVNMPVALPEDYTNHIFAKYQEIRNTTSQANSKLQRAEQIEREYLFKACNGRNGIDVLDSATYTKICSWRDQFKEPYAIASANYQKQLESLRHQAATAEQQSQIQKQIALQQQMVLQQQYTQILNTANQTTREIQQNTQQMLQGMNSWQTPQVQPAVYQGGSQVICQTIGRITTCN